MKALQINKWFANFSTKLVASFIAILVYKITGNLFFAVFSLVIQSIFNLIFNIICQNAMIVKPQLFLVIRIIPIFIYELLVLILNWTSNFYLQLIIVFGIAISVAFSHCCKYIPSEILYGYNSLYLGAKELGKTKLIERSALILGVICGGIFIDYLPLYLLIVISLVLYAVGSIPLIKDYLKNKNNKKYNKEYVAYAHLVLKEEDHNTVSHVVGLKFRFLYAIEYLFLSAREGIYYIFPLLIYVYGGGSSVIVSALAMCIYELVFGISCYFVGIWESKKDLTLASTIACIISAMSIVLMIFTLQSYWIFIAIGIFAVANSFPSIFVYNRMLQKSRLLGKNNKCIIDKYNMFFVNNSILYVLGLIFPLYSILIGGALCLIVAGLLSSSVEEKTRVLLVNHFQNNEIEENISSSKSSKLFHKGVKKDGK